MKNPSKKIVSAILSSTLILPTLSPCASAMGREKTPFTPKTKFKVMTKNPRKKSKKLRKKLQDFYKKQKTRINASEENTTRINTSEENTTGINASDEDTTKEYISSGRKCVFRKNSPEVSQEYVIYGQVYDVIENIKAQQNEENFAQLNNVINTNGLSAFAKSILIMFLNAEGNLEDLLEDFSIFSKIVMPECNGSTYNEYNYIKYQVGYFALNHTFNQNMTYQNFLQNEQQY